MTAQSSRSGAEGFVTIPSIYDPLDEKDLLNSDCTVRPETQQGTKSYICKYLCCFFLFSNGDRKLRRRAIKVREATNALIAMRTSSSVDKGGGSNNSMQRHKAATKIQSRMRGVLVRHTSLSRFKRTLKKSLDEANRYWLLQKKMRELEELRKQTTARVRKQLSEQYVSDVLEACLALIEESSDASTEIQRMWRGYKARQAYLNRPRKRPFQRPVPKVPKKHRVSAEALRRAWARSLFEPSDKKWLHTTDFGYSRHSMWDNIEKAPMGPRNGMRINKVKALVRSERQKEALLNDRHSWVGIPVGYESELEMNFNESQIEPDNVSKLRRSSPYRSSTFQSSTDGTSVSESEDSVDVRDEIDTIVDNNNSSKVESKRITSKRTEKQILHEIDSLGFSSLAMDPILSTGAPPLGTFSYDPQTGRRIIHKGNNRWVGVLNPNFVVHYNNHFHGNGINQEEGNDDESRSASSTQESLDISLVGSTVQEHQSGAITMTNYSLQNENSMFLRQHKSLFMETFSHRSLSNYSGLHSTTYYDKLLITPSSHLLTNDDGVVMDNNNNGSSRMTSPFAKKTIVPSSPHSKVTMRGGSIDDNINKRELSSWTQLKNSADRMIRMKGIDLENDSLPSDGDSISFNNQSNVANNKYNNYNNNEFLSAVDYDSDEEMWKSRSLYKPRKVVEPKVVVWKRPAQKHYKLKYSWLPQPLVHNAVNNLYYDKTVKDFYSDARRRNVTNYRKELLQGKDRYLFNYERSSLTEQVQQDGLHLPQQQLFSSIILHDEQQQKTNRIPSLRKQGYEVQRTKHNDHNQSSPANIVNNNNNITVKSSEKSTTLSYLHRRASESNVNNNKHDHHLVIDSIKNNKDNIEESSSQKMSADDVSSLGSATATSSFYSIKSSSKKLQKRKNKKSDNFILDVISSDQDGDDDDDDDDVQDAANEIPSPQSNHFMINNRSTSSKRIGSPEADILRSKFKFSPSTSPTAADSSKLRRVASWY